MSMFMTTARRLATRTSMAARMPIRTGTNIVTTSTASPEISITAPAGLASMRPG